MKKLAFWAHTHKNPARLIIILSYGVLNLLALFLGDIFHSLNIEFTPTLYLFAFVLTLTGWMLYPSKSRKKEYRNFFLRQKFTDFILISATFLFTVYFGNTLNKPGNSFLNPVQAISIIYPSNHSNISISSTAKKSVSKKSLRQKIRAEIKSIRKTYKDSSKSQKTGYIILSVFVALLLLYGLAGLTCSIACSGSEALAYVVFFLGLGGIIFGLVKVIQRITRGKPKV